jgi:transposase-like protein
VKLSIVGGIPKEELKNIAKKSMRHNLLLTHLSTLPPKRRQVMAHLEITIQDNIIEVRGQDFCWKFPKEGKNLKALWPILRCFCDPNTGKALWTYQEIADAYGHKSRQNVENFVGEFRAAGEDLYQYLSPNNAKHERLCEPIAEQILTSPFLGIHQQYLAFLEEHRDESLSESTFRKYAGELDVLCLLRRIQTLFSQHSEEFKSRQYLQEILEMEQLPHAKKKEIVECFPETQPNSSAQPPLLMERLSNPKIEQKLFILLLYVCNVSQEMLALVFGVSKTSIHRYIYDVCGDDLSGQILGQIVRWSGQVSFDEKWIKIDGTWHFVLCAVDAVSGFPLLMSIYPNLDRINWTLFFKRFRKLYGVPKLIQSDGCQKLAAAREAVFPRVRYQLCKFHKLKNLMKRIRRYVRDAKDFRRAVRFAKHIFSNTWVSSRKQAAKSLQELAGQEVSSYIDVHILSCWRQLTMSLTNNVSERFNRKIEKCFSGRYGISSVESAEVLLRGLWLKELLLNGHQHRSKTSELASIDLSRICQENLDSSKILHFFHDYEASQVKKVA